MKTISMVCPRCKCLVEVNEPDVNQLDLMRTLAPEVEGCENLAPITILDPEGD